jgi:hypothetical protein
MATRYDPPHPKPGRERLRERRAVHDVGVYGAAMGGGRCSSVQIAVDVVLDDSEVVLPGEPPRRSLCESGMVAPVGF